MGRCHSQQYIKYPSPFFLLIYWNKKPVPILPVLIWIMIEKRNSIICRFWVGISKECFIQWFQSAAVETKGLIQGLIKQLGDTYLYLGQRQRKTTWGGLLLGRPSHCSGQTLLLILMVYIQQAIFAYWMHPQWYASKTDEREIIGKNMSILGNGINSAIICGVCWW